MANQESFSYIDVERIDENLFCQVCKRPYEDPRSFVCRHVFCYDCITKSKQGDFVYCFSCPTKIPYQSLELVNYPLQNMLNKLRIKCSICGESQLERGKFDHHISQGCFKPTFCISNDGENSCPEVGQQNSASGAIVDSKEHLLSVNSSHHVQTMPKQRLPSITSEENNAVDHQPKGLFYKQIFVS